MFYVRFSTDRPEHLDAIGKVFGSLDAGKEVWRDFLRGEASLNKILETAVPVEGDPHPERAGILEDDETTVVTPGGVCITFLGYDTVEVDVRFCRSSVYAASRLLAAITEDGDVPDDLDAGNPIIAEIDGNVCWLGSTNPRSTSSRVMMDEIEAYKSSGLPIIRLETIKQERSSNG